MKKIWLLAAAMGLAASPAFAADNEIAVGMTLSQTGPLNVDSVAMYRGCEMWRDDVNADGGIKIGDKHYKVRFITYDDQSVGGRVQQLYTRLIVQDKAQFLFSPYSSGLGATASIISEQYGKIMVDGGAAEEKMFELGNKYLFQVITSASHYLTGSVETLAAKDPHAKVAFVYSDDPFSKAVVAAAEDQAKEAGLQIVMDESYPPNQTDFSPVINKIVSSNADALLGGGHYADGATMARQIHDQKAPLKWVSLLVAPDSPQFATLGPAANGISVPSQWEPQVKYQPNYGGMTASQFAQKFEAKYKIAADYHAASGYAEGQALQWALEHAGSTDTDKVAAALNGMDITTFFGRMKFAADAKHHGLQLEHAMVLAQWQMKDGKLAKEVVWPDSAKSAPVQFPIH